MGQEKRILGGRYEIEAAIGEGGMAKVFRATDNVLGRTVAVKVLAPQFAQDKQFVTRFRREAQAAARLNHPNIVSVFDTGSAGNVHYIVMEYVEGRTLRDAIRDGALLPERAVEIAEATVRALAVAHDKGLVHRDVKPANIMLTGDGAVKVMDFGIARTTTTDTLTQTAAVLGTASYLSPEQAQGEPVDARSDIYSLGCVLYEMLTGQQPFTGESPVSIAYKHVAQAPTSPSRLNPDIPAGIEAVALKAMAKDPDHRYQSAPEMAEDLRRVAQGLPVEAAPIIGADTTQMIQRGDQTSVLAPLEEEEEPEEGRRRTGLILLITFLVLAALGLGAFFLTQALGEDGETVRVPRVIGFNEEAAVQTLRGDGFRVEIKREFDRRVDTGVVIDQDPEPRAEVDEGSAVTIIVSRGERQVEVPEVRGLSEDEARQEIEDAGLEVGDVTTQPHADVPEGTVISQSPEPEERVDRGSQVNLVVSSGSPTVAVPDVMCRTPGRARQMIEAADLEYAESDDEPFSTECEGAPNRVIAQNPSAGAEVAPGTTVTVTRSAGPSPTPEEEEDGMNGGVGP